MGREWGELVYDVKALERGLGKQSYLILKNIIHCMNVTQGDQAEPAALIPLSSLATPRFTPSQCYVNLYCFQQHDYGGL